METFSRKQSVEEYASLSNAAAKGYSTTRYQRGFKTASFKDFRAAARKSHEEWTQKRENYEKEVQKLKETFLPSIASAVLSIGQFILQGLFFRCCRFPCGTTGRKQALILTELPGHGRILHEACT